jgi:hypothetical protein
MKVLMMMGLYSKLRHIQNPVVKSTVSPQCSIHRYTWTSPGRKTPSQVDNILIDRRQNLSILDVRCFRGADYDTDPCLVVPKIRKRAIQKSDMEIFNFKKLLTVYGS